MNDTGQVHGRYEQRFLRVIDHIHSNLDGNLSLDALADVAALSRFHWHRIYRGLMGETITATIRRARLARAANDLIEGCDPVDGIARRYGYPTRRSFERAFRDHFGKTPTAFRAGPPGPETRGDREDGMKLPVEVKTLEEQQIAALLHEGPFANLGGTLHKLMTLLATRGIVPVGAPLAVFLTSDEIPEAKRRAWIGIPVGDAAAKLEAPLRAVTIAGGPYAMGSYRGPYGGLPKAWDWLCGPWLSHYGGDVRDVPTFEVYADDPINKPAEDVLTEIYLPVTA